MACGQCVEHLTLFCSSSLLPLELRWWYSHPKGDHQFLSLLLVVVLAEQRLLLEVEAMSRQANDCAVFAPSERSAIFRALTGLKIARTTILASLLWVFIFFLKCLGVSGWLSAFGSNDIYFHIQRDPRVLLHHVFADSAMQQRWAMSPNHSGKI